MAINVTLIDDRELFRAGLTCLINDFNHLNIVRACSSSDYKSAFKQEKGISMQDLIILSVDHATNNFCSVFTDLNRLSNKTPWIILAGTYTKSTILKAIENGVSAFYSKTISPEKLREVINEITSVKNYSDIKLDLISREILLNKDTKNEIFTTAETEVLNLVCQQKSNAEISIALEISIRTVESRKRSMMKKTNSKNMIGVVTEYLRFT